MTHLEPEDILRRALHQAAESVEPTTDGLSRIRTRLSTPRPLAIAWLVAAWEIVSQFVMLRLEPALAALASLLSPALRAAEMHLRPVTERLQPVADRLRPALGWLLAAVAWLRRAIKPQGGSEERPSRYGWVRPVIAMAVVVLVAVGGGLALSGLPSQIAREGLNVFSSQPHGSGGSARAPGTSGHGQNLPTPSATSRSGATPSPSPSCSPKPKPKPTPTPTPTPAPTPTQTPTTTPTTTPPTPTPSPSGSGSNPTPSTNQGTQSASASQSAQLSAVFVTGQASEQSNPSPSPSC